MKYISHTDTNVLIRQSLKDAYPNVKFRVAKRGNSTDISYTDGPSSMEVEERVAQFRGASFDGMTDMESPVSHEVDGETVHYGANYIFATREISPEAAQRAVAFLSRHGVSLPDNNNESIETPNYLLYMRQELNVYRMVRAFAYREELIRLTDELLMVAAAKGRVF